MLQLTPTLCFRFAAWISCAHHPCSVTGSGVYIIELLRVAEAKDRPSPVSLSCSDPRAPDCDGSNCIFRGADLHLVNLAELLHGEQCPADDRLHVKSRLASSRFTS